MPHYIIPYQMYDGIITPGLLNRGSSEYKGLCIYRSLDMMGESGWGHPIAGLLPSSLS